MGPNSRRGPAVRKNEEKRGKAIQDALSEALTPREKNLGDRMTEFAYSMSDRVYNARKPAEETPKYGMGGEVEMRQGDVRDNSKRGKCY